MQFMVHMRDGATFRIEAAYIEVIAAGECSYTFLGPVPGYPMAILASFPLELVAAVVPAAGKPPLGPRPVTATASRATASEPTASAPTASAATASAATASAATASRSTDDGAAPA